MFHNKIFSYRHVNNDTKFVDKILKINFTDRS